MIVHYPRGKGIVADENERDYYVYWEGGGKSWVRKAAALRVEA